MTNQRIENEIAHGKHIKSIWSGKLRYWETPAGKIRLKRRVKLFISQLSAGMNVLELGCAVGYFTKQIAKAKINLTAVDISPNLLNIAKSNINTPNVKFKIENAHQMSFPDNTFDCVLGSSVLHHLDLEKAIVEISRVLKPGGSMVFIEPNMLNPVVYWGMRTKFGAKVINKSPNEMAFYRWEIKKYLKDSCFKNILIKPIDFVFPPIPPLFISIINDIGIIIEKIPLIKEIAGCLYIVAKKDAV